MSVAQKSNKKSKSSEAAAELLLPVTMDISEAVGLKKALMLAVDSDRDLNLDASDVERMSAACAQVLIAADRDVEERGHRVRMTGASTVMQSAMTELGLGQLMEKWSPDK
ncbi:STAS domain-containing protein [Hwanghaeella grinnelliae]|uniref:STAS domain-containing protein n=1 Tax=Hwanghaeella grinnelliae TaxID=2500179 RepID=UPI000FDAE2D8|nr:STAS domain-containing protein [Hwanghaeella grinnelliae]